MLFSDVVNCAKEGKAPKADVQAAVTLLKSKLLDCIGLLSPLTMICLDQMVDDIDVRL